MKKILSSFLLIFTVLVSYAVPYITVTEECPYLRFSGSTLQDIVIDKSQVKLQQTSTKVSVVFLSGGAQTLSWDSKQARSYGYSLDSLYDFILEKLKIQCDTSGRGISQSTLDDSLAAIRNYIENNTYIQTDSSTITDYVVLASQNAPPVSPTTGDTYLVGNSPSGAWVGHAKDIAEWNGSSWDFTDAVQGNYLYNTANALTYIFRSGSWVQTTGIPALHNGNTISLGLQIGTNNAKSLTFETNNTNRGRIDSIGRFHVYNLPASTDTFVAVTDVVGKFGKIGKSSFLSGVGGGGSNLKIRYDIDSIRMWNESTTDTVVLGYALRSVALNAGGDSLVFYQANTRTALFIGGGSGGAELSAITAATGTNTINNGNNSQNWQWNSLTGTGLKLSNNFTGTQNGSVLLDIENTGTIGTASQNTTALKVTNSKSSSGANSIGVDIVMAGADADGLRITNTSSVGVGIELTAGMNGGGIQMNGNRHYYNSNTQWIGYEVGIFQFNAGSVRNFFLNSGTSNYWCFASGTTSNLLTFNRISANNHAIFFNGDYIGGYYRAETASNNIIKSNGGSLTITGNTGLAGGFANFTPTDILTVYGTNTNVGIGTTTPNASAILDLTSTTKGVLMPRMTATQASAITAVDGLIIYATDTNGTFTSIGFWGRENGTWIKL